MKRYSINPRNNLKLSMRKVLISSTILLSSLASLSACSTTMPPQTIISNATTQKADTSVAFLEMADRHASRILQASPEWATQLGVSEDIGGQGYGARLSDYGKVGNDRLALLNALLLAELLSVDRKNLSGTAQVTYDVMLNAYQVAARQNEMGIGVSSVLWVNQPYTVDQLFGAHIMLPRLFIAQMPVKNAEQMEHYLIRLAQFERALIETAGQMEVDAKKGAIPPDFVLQSVATAARGFIDKPVNDNPLITSFQGKLKTIDGLTSAQKTEALLKGYHIIETAIYPAYLEFASRVEALIPQSSHDAGIWKLNDGAKLYQIALDNYGANGLTADDIHDIGLKDVSRIHAEMDAILKARGYIKGSVGERMNALSKDPLVLTPNNDIAKAEVIKTLEVYIQNVMAVAPQWFATLPTQPIEVRRIPKYEESSASGAYYTPPSLDGSQPGIFWINLKDTADWPTYALKSLVYHEGVPGHHFQASLQLGISDMPLIRNMMWFADYGEGWALYAEALAVEMGMYTDDPLGNLGRLKAELYRASRLVIDTGIHDKRWSREKAIAWMVEATGETTESITREIDRYSVWPGQATSYKIGMIKFQRIRAKAEQELGSKFDIREFHDFVLNAGAMPMPVMEARVDAWIQATKGE